MNEKVWIRLFEMNDERIVVKNEPHPDDLSLHEYMEGMSEFSNADELLHSRVYHPEGESGSLVDHMVAVYNKWETIPHATRLGFFGILFHDIGKQECADWKGDDKGFHSFIKHESVGERIFTEKYQDLNDFVSENKLCIAWIIRQHTNFWNVQKYGKSLALVNHPCFPVLAEVCLADKMGYKNDEWIHRLHHFWECWNKNEQEELQKRLDKHLEDIEAQEKESAEWESNEQTRYDWSE